MPKIGEFLNGELVSLLPVHCREVLVDAVVTSAQRRIHIEREDAQLLLDSNLGILDFFSNEAG